MKSKLWLRSFANFIRPLMITFLSVFFDRNYLKGRYFDPGFWGYRWALKALWCRNVLRLAPPYPWPVAMSVTISNPKNIVFHPDDLNNFQSPGLYLQNFSARIEIGRGTYIAPNVGVITANHRLDDLNTHDDGKDVVLGEKCWIGMNTVILPGVVLGTKTVVAAGSVVTKSFPEGNIVIGGVPAKLIKSII